MTLLTNFHFWRCTNMTSSSCDIYHCQKNMSKCYARSKMYIRGLQIAHLITSSITRSTTRLLASIWWIAFTILEIDPVARIASVVSFSGTFLAAYSIQSGRYADWASPPCTDKRKYSFPPACVLLPGYRKIASSNSFHAEIWRLLCCWHLLQLGK